MKETHNGSIDVAFDGMPSIRLETYQAPAGAGFLQRLALATRRRRFSLRENWHITLDDVDFFRDLNGVVEVPAKHSDKQSIIFDGASIPFPWLISLLTVGILRPLGVMLVGSILHDYAYQYGSLRVSRSGGAYEQVPLTRDRADRLFRDVVGTVNELPMVGYIAWFAVRIGWLWVRYNGKRFGGKPPIAEYALLLVILGVLSWLLMSLGLVKLLALATAGYFIFYFASLIAIRRMGLRP